MQRDAIDVAVLSAERVPRGLPAEVLGIDELIVVESAQHPVSSEGSMTFSELALAPFVRLTIGGERLAIDLDRLLAERGVGPRNFVMDVTGWDGVKEAVRAGVGLAVCSRGVVQRELDRGDLRVVSAPAYREIRTIQLVHSPRWEMQQASAAFVDLLGRLRSELPKLLRLQAS